MFLRAISSFFNLIQEKKPKFHYVWNLGFCGCRLLPTTHSRPLPVIRGLWAPPFSYFSFLYLCLSFYIALLLESAASRLLKSAKGNTEGILPIITRATKAPKIKHPSISAIAVLATTINPRGRRADRLTIISVPSILFCRFLF